MSRYLVVGDAIVTELDGSLGEPDDLELFLGQVIDEMTELDGSDHDISAILSTGEVAFSVVVEAGDPLEAVAQGAAIIRTAVHAAGGHTPEWSLKSFKVMAEPELVDA